MRKFFLVWLAMTASLHADIIITSVASPSASKSVPVFEIRNAASDIPIKAFIVHGGWIPLQWENAEFSNPPFSFTGRSSRAEATVSVRPESDGFLLEASTASGELTLMLITDDAFDNVEVFNQTKNEAAPNLKVDTAGLRRVVGGGEVWLRGRKITFKGDGIWRVDELAGGGCKIRISGQNLSIQILPAP